MRDKDDLAFLLVGTEDRIRQLLKLPHLEIEILSFSNWTLERVLAENYRQGRVFIGGDSAHHHPPTTGLGLNTAVQDAHNLAWKLAYTIQGKSSSGLLNTYEIERLSVGRRNCDGAFFTSQGHAVIAAAIGFRDGEPDDNKARLRYLFDQQAELAAAARAQLQYIIDGQAVEFNAHGMDGDHHGPWVHLPAGRCFLTRCNSAHRRGSSATGVHTIRAPWPPFTARLIGA
ncbi:hypothetical protein NM208_g3521 [Fusarium decemcellulare]|uniref:Uncharacterized protein n=1 Tax=Fusarium decemcellulare TaxID=57161 RepID=A0ACC1SNS6_9HYPO|nr:hypothetical protein NM208_g3521 [Fusarium decemcellulare]